MFGVVRPCRHGMCATLFKDWMAHLCGLCLTLRAEHGQAARLVTNYDGLLVSVLVEAQNPERSPHRAAGRCALRGLRGADVVDHGAEGARLAAAVSLLLAAGKTRDHVADRDGAYARRPVAAMAGVVARRWDRAGARTGGELGFDIEVLRGAVERQTALESTGGLGLLNLTEPTETAVAAAFAHTAVLAGKPRNAEPLAETGRFFGRLAHLIDAVEDLPADRASGAFNPLLASGTDLAQARRHATDALRGLRLALADVQFERRRLVDALLVRELGRSVDRAFEQAGDGKRPGWWHRAQHPYGPQQPPFDPPWPPHGPQPHGPQPSGPGKRAPFLPRPARPGPGLLCPAWTLVGCTCGLWQPPWSPFHSEHCGERCWCTRHCDGNGCDCDCSGCCDCGDGCCCDCNCCDCNC